MTKFLRRDARRFSKFGKGRGKKAKWRSPKGRDNKMRERIKGHPVSVSIGYSTKKTERGKVKEKIPMIVQNLEDLKKMKKENIAIIGKVGKKKKIEILEKAKEMKIEVAKTNIEKALTKLKGAKKNEPKK
jgi:ribosomal protein L32E